MSDEIYAATSRYSFLMFILVMRSGAVSELVGVFPDTILIFLASLFGWHLRTA